MKSRISRIIHYVVCFCCAKINSVIKHSLPFVRFLLIPIVDHSLNFLNVHLFLSEQPLHLQMHKWDFMNHKCTSTGYLKHIEHVFLLSCVACVSVRCDHISCGNVL